MTESKLDLFGAAVAGNKLAETVLEIQQRHQLSDGDTIALITVTFTAILQLKIGAAATVDYCRDHADELERGLLAAMARPPIGKQPGNC